MQASGLPGPNDGDPCDACSLFGTFVNGCFNIDSERCRSWFQRRLKRPRPRLRRRPPPAFRTFSSSEVRDSGPEASKVGDHNAQVEAREPEAEAEAEPREIASAPGAGEHGRTQQGI